MSFFYLTVTQLNKITLNHTAQAWFSWKARKANKKSRVFVTNRILYIFHALSPPRKDNIGAPLKIVSSPQPLINHRKYERPGGSWNDFTNLYWNIIEGTERWQNSLEGLLDCVYFNEGRKTGMLSPIGTPQSLCNNEDTFLPLQGLDSLKLFPFKG